jgi:hypothetical protein
LDKAKLAHQFERRLLVPPLVRTSTSRNSRHPRRARGYTERPLILR